MTQEIVTKKLPPGSDGLPLLGETLSFMPQGAGELSGHKCAGYDFSTVMMQLFAILLVPGYQWELPRQDSRMRWNRIPPEPKSGLVVRARRL